MVVTAVVVLMCLQKVIVTIEIAVGVAVVGVALVVGPVSCILNCSCNVPVVMVVVVLVVQW